MIHVNLINETESMNQTVHALHFFTADSAPLPRVSGYSRGARVKTEIFSFFLSPCSPFLHTPQLILQCLAATKLLPPGRTVLSTRETLKTELRSVKKTVSLGLVSHTRP